MNTNELSFEMTKRELLSKLKNVTFAVFMTALPTEMCLEIQTMTPDGTCYLWIGYDDWKVFVLKKRAQENWDKIIEKIKKKTLEKEDIEGTDLDKLLNSLSDYIEEPTNYSSLFSELLEIPLSIHETLYAYYNDNKLKFFQSKEELKKELQRSYSAVDVRWEDMDIFELNEWWERYQEGGDNLPAVVFDNE